MDVNEAIEKRRAYRALAPVEITDGMIRELAVAARLAPSCFNMQPWQYVFVRGPDMLARMHDALSQGNEWARDGSLIIAVFSEKEADCVIRDREYYQFDTGLATGQMLLRATELDLVAHPIAGFSPRKVKEILGIPEGLLVITLVIVGRRSEGRTENITDEQMESEDMRPERKSLDEFVHLDRYNNRFKIQDK
jgi:nitroreductase